jgi:predicted PurR-regulated permease PerM
VQFIKKCWNDIRKVCYFTALALIAAVCLLYATNELARIFGKENQWDSLAFVGAVVGGALTLIGVRITIINQAESEFFKRLPNKRRSSDNIIVETDRVVFLLNTLDVWEQWGNNFDTFIKRLEDFIARSSDLLEYAAEVSEQTYLSTRDFIRTTSNFVLTFNHYRVGDVLQDDRFKHFHEELKRIHSEIEQEANREITRYRK